MAKACHNCRRQRLKCDASTPICLKCVKRGQECLGYQPLLRWERGIASRGKMAGKTFGKRDLNEPNPMVSLPKDPTDPMLQDMGFEDRKYLAYCKRIWRLARILSTDASSCKRRLQGSSAL